MVALSRAIGRKRALEMLLTGGRSTRATALEWGLVNRVVAVETWTPPWTSSWRDRRFEPAHLAIGKEAFYAQIERDEHRAYDLTKWSWR